jgi:Fe2+ transport system protein FeoA
MVVKKRSICHLKRGESGTVSHLDADHHLSQRLMMMGIHRGQPIRMLERAPLGGALALEAGTFRIAIRQSDAAGVWLED